MDIDPINIISSFYINEIRENSNVLKLVGFLASEQEASKKYAEMMGKTCKDVGIAFEVKKVNKYDLEYAIIEANEDDSITGIMVYYPIFDSGHDSYLRNLVSPLKDVEGLNFFWLQKLYANIRNINNIPAVVPCTPLAVMKILTSSGLVVQDKTITIFNRSEIVGRPLAAMLANDGATVYSFDAKGAIYFRPAGGQNERDKPYPKATQIQRHDALKLSSIIISGVPDKLFKKIEQNEIQKGAFCINVSEFENFDENIANEGVLIPRIGKVTIAMALRNLTRLAKHQQLKKERVCFNCGQPSWLE